MKDRLILLAFAVCAVSSIACMALFWLPQRSTSDLEVLPSEFQKIGPIRQATDAKVEYTICNRVSVPVQILDTMTTCTCTGIEIPKKELGPGESIPVALKFNTGASRISMVVRAVIAYRRHGERETRILRVAAEAEIDPDYSVEPERVVFGEDRPVVQRVLVSPRHISALNVKSAVCNLRFFKARIVPGGKSNQQAVEVTFDPKEYYSDAGPGEVVIFTDSQRQPILRVPLEVTDSSVPRSNGGGRQGASQP